MGLAAGLRVVRVDGMGGCAFRCLGREGVLMDGSGLETRDTSSAALVPRDMTRPPPEVPNMEKMDFDDQETVHRFERVRAVST